MMAFLRRPSGPRSLLSVLAAVVLAVAGNGAEPKVFRAGAALSNITPELGIQLRAGSFISYPATHIHDDLHARCLVLDDGATRLAFVVCDALAVSHEVVVEAKRLIEQATGIPGRCVIVTATHTHSAMALRSDDGITVGGELDAYERFMAKRMADGVQRAVNHLAPARIAWGHGALPGQVFNRRWLTRSADDARNPFGGSDQVRMNPPFASPHLIGPAGPTDPEILFLSIQTAAGRPLALLANYSLHYVGGVKSGEVSADYFAVFAARIRELLGADHAEPPFVGIMTNGASGDINNTDFSKPREKHGPYEKIREVAHQAAAEVHRASRDLAYRDRVELRVTHRELPLATRRPTPEQLALARKYLALPPGSSLPKGEARGRESYYAKRVLAMAGRPATTPFFLQAVRIGDVALFTVPAEVFVEIGLELKQRSAFKPAIVLALANGYFGYLPTPRQHALGGYETWLTTNQVEFEASEKIVAALLQMQEEL